MGTYFRKGATRADLLKQSSLKASTFNRALNWALTNRWLLKEDKLYNLNPEAPWDEAESSASKADQVSSKNASTFTSNFHPSRGVEVEESVGAASNGSELEASWKLEQSTSCKNGDTTANGKNLNKNNESKNSPSVAPGPSDDELIKQGIAATKAKAG